MFKVCIKRETPEHPVTCGQILILTRPLCEIDATNKKIIKLKNYYNTMEHVILLRSSLYGSKFSVISY